MENKIKAKRVGDVNIFEICGELTGAFAVRGQEAIQKSIQTNKKKSLLFNVQDLIAIDDLGVNAILQNAGMVRKSALLAGHCPVVSAIQRKDTSKRLPVLKNEAEVTNFFRLELAAPSLEEQFYPERRQFIRLTTVLPLHFWYQTEDNAQRMEFFAVVTNLSEGGLFAQFIESVSEEAAKKMLNPYDLKLLYFRIGLLGEEPLSLRGKIIHNNNSEGGIGVEFYDIDDENKIRMRDWIARHLMEREGGHDKT